MTDLDREVALAMGWTLGVDYHPETGDPSPIWRNDDGRSCSTLPSVTDPAWLRGALLWCAEQGLWAEVFRGWNGQDLLYRARVQKPEVRADSHWGKDADPGTALAKAIVAWQKAR